MAIVKMKKLRLLAVKAQREEIMRELMLLGCVEVTEPDMDTQTDFSLSRENSELAKHRADYTQLVSALKQLDKYAPVKTKFLSPRPEIGQSDFLDEASIANTLETASKICLANEKIRRINVEESRLRSLIESLVPWSTMDIPVDYLGTKLTSAITGSVPGSIDLDSLEAALDSAVPESQVFRISSDKEQHCLLVICLTERYQEVIDSLHAFGFSPPSFGAVEGTAAQNIKESERNLTELAARKKELVGDIAAESGNRELIKLCSDRVKAKLDREESAERLLSSETTVLLEGWVSVPSLEDMVITLERFDCAWEIRDPSGEEIESGQVPVQLSNNAVTRPLNMVTEMYSLPAYDGVDPNPLMAPFFILFYGMMMADMGYGLLMVIAALVVKSKKKPFGGTRTFFELLLLCGISTFAWGIVTAGFFGDAVAQIVRLINPESAFTWFWTPLIDPLNDTLQVLIGSMALGFIHIVTGMVVSFVEKARSGNIMDGIWDEGTWWVIFAGIGMFALGSGNVNGIPVVLVIGALMLIVGSGRNAKGIGKATSVFAALYNGVTGFFGDILSYSRLMALMLAGSVIAQVFNTLAAIPGNIIIFIPIFLVGNALNFALNLLGCYVHDLRLQCLEYFGKFYKDGGRPFKPLSINTKYVNIVK